MVYLFTLEKYNKNTFKPSGSHFDLQSLYSSPILTIAHQYTSEETFVTSHVCNPLYFKVLKITYVIFSISLAGVSFSIGKLPLLLYMNNMIWSVVFAWLGYNIIKYIFLSL